MFQLMMGEMMSEGMEKDFGAGERRPDAVICSTR